MLCRDPNGLLREVYTYSHVLEVCGRTPTLPVSVPSVRCTRKAAWSAAAMYSVRAARFPVKVRKPKRIPTTRNPHCWNPLHDRKVWLPVELALGVAGSQAPTLIPKLRHQQSSSQLLFFGMHEQRSLVAVGTNRRSQV